MASRLHQSTGLLRNNLLVAVREGYMGAPVIEPHGELDFSNRDDLETALRSAVAGPSALILLDLRWLRFIDSAGLHVICKADRDARLQRKRLLIVKGGPSIQRVFSLTNMLERLNFIFVLPGEADAETAAARDLVSP